MTLKSFSERATVATIVALFMILVSGFLVTNLPVFIYWVRYLSLFKYAMDASAGVIFTYGGISFTCDNGHRLPDCLPGVESVSGESVLMFISPQGGSVGFNVGLIVAIFVVVRMGAYFALRYLHTQSDR